MLLHVVHCLEFREWIRFTQLTTYELGIIPYVHRDIPVQPIQRGSPL